MTFQAVGDVQDQVGVDRGGGGGGGVKHHQSGSVRTQETTRGSITHSYPILKENI
jgi:hypothetical protein